MSSFLQSSIWHDIKTIVYGEDSFSLTLFDQEYFGIIKRKSIGRIPLAWYQVLGVQLPLDNMGRIQQERKRIYQDYSTSTSNISFQWGIVNEILRFPNVSHKSTDFDHSMRETRIHLQERIQKETNLVPSFRENMPLSTIMIDITQSDVALLHDMNSGAKNHIQKSQKHNMEFYIAQPKDYERFYEEWIKIAGLKGFNTIRKDTYLKLMDYLTANNCGNIFMVEKDGDMLGGSIAVYDDTTITYLYGFSNRSPQYKNIGVHHFIKYKMFGWARDHGLQWMDLFGGAPTGFDEHPLTSVSKFKESLGGIKIERYGNYDIILNPFLYQLFKMYHTRKKN